MMSSATTTATDGLLGEEREKHKAADNNDDKEDEQKAEAKAEAPKTAATSTSNHHKHKRLKTTTTTRFVFLPFHLKVLKSLYEDEDDEDSTRSNGDDNEQEETPPPLSKATWEMAANFIAARPNLLDSKQQSLTCRAVSNRATDYAECTEEEEKDVQRPLSLLRNKSKNKTLPLASALLRRQPFMSACASSSGGATATTAAPFFPEMIFSGTNMNNSPRHCHPAMLLPSGQEQQQQQQPKSFRIVAALLGRQSDRVEYDYATQSELPFRPLLQLAQERVKHLVASLQQQEQFVLERDESKIRHYLLMHEHATATSRRPHRHERLSMDNDDALHHQNKGEDKDDYSSSSSSSSSSSLLAATRAKICLWNMLVQDLKVILSS